MKIFELMNPGAFPILALATAAFLCAVTVWSLAEEQRADRSVWVSTLSVCLSAVYLCLFFVSIFAE